MSDADDYIEDDESGKAPKALRDALKAAQKERDELAREIQQFRAEKRQSTVASLLRDAGVREGLAKFYTSEDASPEAVKKWVEENAELFGVDSAPPTPSPEAQAQQQMQQVLNQAPPANTTPSSPAEYMALLDSLPAEELEKRGLI